MPKSYKEQDFEDHIEEYLLASGYHKRLPEDYDRELCLIPDEVITFIKATQPDEYEALEKQYGADTPDKLVYRLSRDIIKHGTLKVLRKGIKDRGVHFRLAYFKPASGMNPKHQQLYSGNRFSVVRQLKYSIKNENEIDLGLFLNGIPIITAELKNSLTGQFMENAIKQYKYDRDPKGEPLLQFKRCLVHFAVGNEKVSMTTRLMGKGTRFLPFNKDIENPINPNGHKSAYLWEDIWQPATLLELIDNYLHIHEKTEKYWDKDKGLHEEKYEILIFPRYHQLDVVRKILSAVKQEGVGENYLIHHSAGSGKSYSIAWLVTQLAHFYQSADDKERLFDSIIVVTDRRVLDKQLQDTIKQFEQTTGVVMPIEKTSAQLREALEKSKDIIITTIQKFPMISEAVTGLPGKRFAVMVDEAHSGQSGETAKHLKKTLSAGLEDAEEEDKIEFDLEDEIVQEIQHRGKQDHISYFAFTATPKGKTLELFGRKNEAGEFRPFHTYSMRQAIKESFILDILKNYTTFQRYFKLVKAIPDDDEYEKKKAVRLLTRWVDLQPHAIESKAGIMLEHFLDVTVNAIQGKGRAMVVTRSRLHAVKFYLAIKKLLEEKNLPFKALVAFSGTVKDPDTGAEFTENSLNRLGRKVTIPDAYKTPEFRILVVAEKFQTGFDEPLLHTMYVDKKLANVHAVQTLSRLNRTMRGKTDTFVLDFVNENEAIQEAFQNYYEGVFLPEETDPNKLYDLQSELEDYEVYTISDIEDFAEVFYNINTEPELMQPILDKVVHLWRNKTEDEREDFRSVLIQFIRLYGFVSQVVTFVDTGLEKLYVFARHLSRKLDKRKGTLPYEIQEAIDLDSFRIQQTFAGDISLDAGDAPVPGIDAGTGGTPPEGEKDLLSMIIQGLNEVYGVNISDEDKLDMHTVLQKITADEELQAVMDGDNTLENKQYKFDSKVDEHILGLVQTKLDLYKKLTDPRVNAYIKRRWFEQVRGTGA